MRLARAPNNYKILCHDVDDTGPPVICHVGPIRPTNLPLRDTYRIGLNC